ncbi:MAG: hypothetical protein QW530_00740 [Candidatus Micrarchaeaceae archaeon]
MVMGAPTYGSGTGVSGSTQPKSKAKSSGSSASGAGGSTSPPAAGYNQVPGWIAAALKSGAISSYTNPNTGQTFTAQSLSNPNVSITSPTTTYFSASSTSSPAGGGAGGGGNSATSTPSVAAYSTEVAAENAQAAKAGTQFSVSQAEQAGYTVMPYPTAPGGYILLKGGSQYNIYGNPIPAALQAPTAVAQAYSNAWSNGSTIVQNALPVDYATFGTNAQITWTNGPHNPEFTLTETLPDGKIFTYSGSVSGVPLGSVLATNQAVDQAWNALIAGAQQVNSAPSGTAISVAQGAGGLAMGITPPITGGAGPYQTITLANGLTENLPTEIALNGIVTTGTWKTNGNSYTFIPTSAAFSSGGTTITLQNPTVSQLESYGFTQSEAQNLIASASSLTLILSPNNGSYSIVAQPTPGSTTTVNVPLNNLNGQPTTATIPIVYAYNADGTATPTGFGNSSNPSPTYSTTIGGISYIFSISNGEIVYSGTSASTANPATSPSAFSSSMLSIASGGYTVISSPSNFFSANALSSPNQLNANAFVAASGDYTISNSNPLPLNANSFTAASANVPAPAPLTASPLSMLSAASGGYTITSFTSPSGIFSANSIPLQFYQTFGIAPPISAKATMSYLKEHYPSVYEQTIASTHTYSTSTAFSQDYLTALNAKPLTQTQVTELLVGGTIAGLAVSVVLTGGADSPIVASVVPELAGESVGSILAWRGISAAAAATLTEASSYASTGQPAPLTTVAENAGIAALTAGIGVGTGILPKAVPVGTMLGTIGRYAFSWGTAGTLYGAVYSAASNYGENKYIYNGVTYTVPYGFVEVVPLWGGQPYAVSQSQLVPASSSGYTMPSASFSSYAYDSATHQLVRVLKPESLTSSIVQGATQQGLQWAQFGVEAGPVFDLVGRAISAISKPISETLSSKMPQNIVARTFVKGASKSAITLGSGTFFATTTALSVGTPQQTIAAFAAGMTVPFGIKIGNQIGANFEEWVTPPISTEDLRLKSIVVQQTTPMETGIKGTIRKAIPEDILAEYERNKYVIKSSPQAIATEYINSGLPVNFNSERLPSAPEYGYISTPKYIIKAGYGGSYAINPEGIAKETENALPRYFTQRMIERVASSIATAVAREQIGSEFLNSIGGKAPLPEGAIYYPERNMYVLVSEGPQSVAQSKGLATFVSSGGTTFYVESTANPTYTTLSGEETAATSKVNIDKITAVRTNIFGQTLSTELPTSNQEPLITSTSIITPSSTPQHITISDFLNTQVGGINAPAYMPNRLLSVADLLQVNSNLAVGEYTNVGPTILKGGEITIWENNNPALPAPPSAGGSAPAPEYITPTTAPVIQEEEIGRVISDTDRIKNVLSTEKYTTEFPQTLKDIYGTPSTEIKTNTANPEASQVQASTGQPAQVQLQASPTQQALASASAVQQASVQPQALTMPEQISQAVAFPLIDPNATMEMHTGLKIGSFPLAQTPQSQFSILNAPPPHYVEGQTATFLTSTQTYLTNLNTIANLEETLYEQNLTAYYSRIGKAEGMTQAQIKTMVTQQSKPFTEEIQKIEKAISTLILEVQKMRSMKNIPINDIVELEAAEEVLQKYLQALEAYALAYSDQMQFIPYQYNENRLKNLEKNMLKSIQMEKSLQQEEQLANSATITTNLKMPNVTVVLPPALNSDTYSLIPEIGKIAYVAESMSQYHPSITAITFPEEAAQRQFSKAYIPEAKGIEVRPLVEPKVRAHA